MSAVKHKIQKMSILCYMHMIEVRNLSVLDKIIALLKEQGKKQKDLTDYLGITKNVFTDWKSGRINSYTKYLPQIADFFGVSVDCLLGNTEKTMPRIAENTVIYRKKDDITEEHYTDEQMDYVERFLKSLK